MPRLSVLGTLILEMHCELILGMQCVKFVLYVSFFAVTKLQARLRVAFL